jgi:hypothetical protein
MFLPLGKRGEKMSGQNVVCMVMGWSGDPNNPANEKYYEGNRQAILRVIPGLLPKGTIFICTDYRPKNNVGQMIADASDDGRNQLILCGFSFGGQRAVEVAGEFPSVRGLFLFDPVNYHNNVPNTTFRVPPSVHISKCWRRASVTAIPYSGVIVASSNCGHENIIRPPTSNNPHGEMVWDRSIWAKIVSLMG